MEDKDERDKLQQDIEQIHQLLSADEGGSSDEEEDAHIDDELQVLEENYDPSQDVALQIVEDTGPTTNGLQEGSLGLVEVVDMSHQEQQQPPARDLLLHNQQYQRIIQTLLAQVQQALSNNVTEQKEVERQILAAGGTNYDGSAIIKKPPVRSMVSFFKPYFRDDSGHEPPPNVEAKERKSIVAQDPFITAKVPWTKHELKNLQEGVHNDRLRRIQQPLWNRQELLQDKLSNPELEDDEKEKLEREIEDIDDSISKARVSGGVRRRMQSEKIDWMRISSMDLEGERSPLECELQWNALDSTDLNKTQWTTKEENKLLGLVAKHKGRDWETIASELGTGRSAFQCFTYYRCNLDQDLTKKSFTSEESDRMLKLVKKYRTGNYIPYTKIAHELEGHSHKQLCMHWISRLDPQIKTGKWSKEEDQILRDGVTSYGTKNWSIVASAVKGRTSIQCRDRWYAHVCPTIKRGHWSPQEDLKMINLIIEHGLGNWKLVANKLAEGDKVSRTCNSLLIRFRNMVARLKSGNKRRTRTKPQEMTAAKKRFYDNLSTEELLQRLRNFKEEECRDECRAMENRRKKEEENKKLERLNPRPQRKTKNKEEKREKPERPQRKTSKEKAIAAAKEPTLEDNIIELLKPKKNQGLINKSKLVRKSKVRAQQSMDNNTAYAMLCKVYDIKVKEESHTVQNMLGNRTHPRREITKPTQQTTMKDSAALSDRSQQPFNTPATQMLRDMMTQEKSDSSSSSVTVNQEAVIQATVNPVGVNQAGVKLVIINQADANQNQVAVNQVATNQVAVSQAVINQVAVNQAVINQVGVNQAVINQVAINQEASNKAVINQAAIKHTAASQAATNQGAVNQAATSQMSANHATTVNQASSNHGAVNHVSSDSAVIKLVSIVSNIVKPNTSTSRGNLAPLNASAVVPVTSATNDDDDDDVDMVSVGSVDDIGMASMESDNEDMVETDPTQDIIPEDAIAQQVEITPDMETPVVAPAKAASLVGGHGNLQGVENILTVTSTPPSSQTEEAQTKLTTSEILTPSSQAITADISTPPQAYQPNPVKLVPASGPGIMTSASKPDTMTQLTHVKVVSTSAPRTFTAPASQLTPVRVVSTSKPYNTMTPASKPCTMTPATQLTPVRVVSTPGPGTITPALPPAPVRIVSAFTSASKLTPMRVVSASKPDTMTPTSQFITPVKPASGSGPRTLCTPQMSSTVVSTPVCNTSSLSPVPIALHVSPSNAVRSSKQPPPVRHLLSASRQYQTIGGAVQTTPTLISRPLPVLPPTPGQQQPFPTSIRVANTITPPCVPQSNPLLTQLASVMQLGGQLQPINSPLGAIQSNILAGNTMANQLQQNMIVVGSAPVVPIFIPGVGQVYGFVPGSMQLAPAGITSSPMGVNLPQTPMGVNLQQTPGNNLPGGISTPVQSGMSQSMMNVLQSLNAQQITPTGGRILPTGIVNTQQMLPAGASILPTGIINTQPITVPNPASMFAPSPSINQFLPIMTSAQQVPINTVGTSTPVQQMSSPSVQSTSLQSTPVPECPSTQLAVATATCSPAITPTAQITDNVLPTDDTSLTVAGNQQPAIPSCEQPPSVSDSTQGVTSGDLPGVSPLNGISTGGSIDQANSTSQPHAVPQIDTSQAISTAHIVPVEDDPIPDTVEKYPGLKNPSMLSTSVPSLTDQQFTDVKPLKGKRRRKKKATVTQGSGLSSFLPSLDGKSSGLSGVLPGLPKGIAANNNWKVVSLPERLEPDANGVTQSKSSSNSHENVAVMGECNTELSTSSIDNDVDADPIMDDFDDDVSETVSQETIPSLIPIQNTQNQIVSYTEQSTPHSSSSSIVSLPQQSTPSSSPVINQTISTTHNLQNVQQTVFYPVSKSSNVSQSVTATVVQPSSKSLPLPSVGQSSLVSLPQQSTPSSPVINQTISTTHNLQNVQQTVFYPVSKSSNVGQSVTQTVVQPSSSSHPLPSAGQITRTEVQLSPKLYPLPTVKPSTSVQSHAGSVQPITMDQLSASSKVGLKTKVIGTLQDKTGPFKIVRIIKQSDMNIPRVKLLRPGVPLPPRFDVPVRGVVSQNAPSEQLVRPQVRMLRPVKSIASTVASIATPNVAPNRPATLQSGTLQQTVSPAMLQTGTLQQPVSQASLQTVSQATLQTGTLQQTVSPATLQTGTLQQPVSQAMLQTGTLQQTISPATLQTGTLQQLVSPAMLQTATPQQTITPATLQTGTLQQIVSPATLQSSILQQTLSPATLQTGIPQQIVSPAMLQTNPLQQTVSPFILHTGTLQQTVSHVAVRKPFIGKRMPAHVTQPSTSGITVQPIRQNATQPVQSSSIGKRMPVDFSSGSLSSFLPSLDSSVDSHMEPPPVQRIHRVKTNLAKVNAMAENLVGTQDANEKRVPLLPPNYATLTGLKTLLLHRKALEARTRKCTGQETPKKTFRGYMANRSEDGNEPEAANQSEHISEQPSLEHILDTPDFKRLQERFMSVFAWPALLSTVPPISKDKPKSRGVEQRGRGRLKKPAIGKEAATTSIGERRGRGRPKKITVEAKASVGETSGQVTSEAIAIETATTSVGDQRLKGRPQTTASEAATTSVGEHMCRESSEETATEAATGTVGEQRRRGRPKKTTSQPSTVSVSESRGIIGSLEITGTEAETTSVGKPSDRLSPMTTATEAETASVCEPRRRGRPKTIATASELESTHNMSQRTRKRSAKDANIDGVESGQSAVKQAKPSEMDTEQLITDVSPSGAEEPVSGNIMEDPSI